MIFLLTVYFFFVPLSDIKIKIADAQTGSPVPYAVVLSSQFNGIADENGVVIVPEKLDSLTFRCVGYEQCRLAFKDLTVTNGTATVKLKPKTFALEAVGVTAHRIKKIPLGYYRKKAEATHGSSGGGQTALFFPPDKRGQLVGIPIGSVSFYIRDWGNYQKKFRVRLYSVNPGSGTPDKDLLPEAVYAQAQKGNEWVDVRVKQYGIKFPVNGFFVAIEFLPDAVNASSVKEKTGGPYLGGNCEDENNGRTWDFIFNKQEWVQDLPTHKNEFVGNAMIKVEFFKEIKR